MTRKRRARWKTLARTAVLAAGATATVALAHAAVALGADDPTPRPVERQCTRFASLSLAAAEGLRQGRIEQAASPRAQVVGRLKGFTVRMTLEDAGDACRLVRIDIL